jgi:hypothetical protein
MRRDSRATGWLVAGLALAAGLVTGCKTDGRAVGVQPPPGKTEVQIMASDGSGPAHPWHQERVQNIRSEKIHQTIEKLANFDDNRLGMPCASGRLECWRNKIPYLARVRRLFKMGQEEPQAVTAALRKALLDSLSEWPDAYEERVQLWKASPQGFTSSEPRCYDKVRTKAMVSTYLLAELRDFDSLPLLVHSYKVQEKWIAEHKYYPAYQYSVHPAMTLYAMHRLISEFPQDRLTKQAHALREVHIEWARANLPPATVIIRRSWHSGSRDRPKPEMLQPGEALVREEGKIKLVLYPDRFADGQEFRWMLEDKVDARTQAWFDQIEQFVDAAFPDSNILQ